MQPVVLPCINHGWLYVLRVGIEAEKKGIDLKEYNICLRPEKLQGMLDNYEANS